MGDQKRIEISDEQQERFDKELQITMDYLKTLPAYKVSEFIFELESSVTTILNNKIEQAKAALEVAEQNLLEFQNK